MKAKKFKKLRKLINRYDVEVTKGLFGEFDNFNGSFITVMALSYENACKRAVRRGVGLNHRRLYKSTTEQWGRFAVKLHSKSNHWKNILYFGS